MSCIIDFFKSDRHCKDRARFYYSNENAVVYFNTGIIFDWKPFLTEPECIESPILQTEKYSAEEMSLEDFNRTGRKFSEVIGTSQADEIYRKSEIYFTVGNRNESFFRLATWLRDSFIFKNELAMSDAVNELWRIYNSIDTTDFPESELETIIKNVFGI